MGGGKTDLCCQGSRYYTEQIAIGCGVNIIGGEMKMNPFTNPYIVGAVFVIVGLIGIIKQNYKGRPSFLDKIIKFSDKTNRIISFVSCSLLLLAGILIIVCLGILSK